MPLELIKTKDAALLAEMNWKLIRDEKHRNRMKVNQLARRMKKWLDSGYRAYFLSENDVVFGYCLFVKTKEYLYIRHFYIEKNHRRLGLGKKAMVVLRAKGLEKRETVKVGRVDCQPPGYWFLEGCGV